QISLQSGDRDMRLQTCVIEAIESMTSKYDEIRNTERNVSSAVTQPSTEQQGDSTVISSRRRPGARRNRSCVYSVISSQRPETPTRRSCVFTVISSQQGSDFQTTYRSSQCRHSLPTQYEQDIQRSNDLLFEASKELATHGATTIIIEMFQQMSQYLLGQYGTLMRLLPRT
uniref:Uncharacterized protein n=1 Tax=Trichobilharzia regenti TaxID=157069 RepID=A0AA85JCI0_TRIRE